MRLLSLTLENFRQFGEGTKTISFSRKQERNVTIVFGANGAGKTTLLNAFTWGLYGLTTPALENPDVILNERAFLNAGIGDQIQGRVTIEFEHEGSKYTVIRTRIEEKTGKKIRDRNLIQEGRVEVIITRENGLSYRPQNPQDIIEQILPSRLYSFFFFDGERIERLTQPSAFEEVEQAIKSILGLELVDRSIHHLGGEVRRRLDTQLKEVGSIEIQEIIDRIQSLNRRKEKAEGDLKQIKETKGGLLTQRDDVRNRLRQLDETRKQQERLDRAQWGEKATKEAISKIDRDTRELVSRKGYLVFMPKIVSKCQVTIEKSRQRGEVPSGIKKQFVEDLLEGGSCICGTPLTPGSHPREAVTEWLNRAGLQDIEDAVVRVGAALKDYNDGLEEFRKQFRNHQRSREEQSAKLRGFQEQISEAERELGDMKGRATEEVQALLEKSEKVGRDLEALTPRISALEAEIKYETEQLEEWEIEKERTQAKSDRARLVQRKLRVCREVTEFLETLLKTQSEEVRSELDKRIKEVYREISYKDYWPELTPDYRLMLKKGYSAGPDQVDMDVAKGTGENQVLSLSFIGGVVDFARKRYEAQKEQPGRRDYAYRGGIYPMVMDSPFGSLDTNYKKSVAEGLPGLTDQVILFLSKGQGLGPVLEAIKRRVDRIYVLAYKTTKKEHKPETIDINGRAWPYISKASSGTESVEIQEVE